MHFLLRLLLSIVLSCAALGAVSAQAPPFNQCPAVGADHACRILILIDTNGSLRVLTDPSQTVAYDSIEDTLIGVLNLSSHTISSIPLRGSTAIFSFDGDGICSPVISPHPSGCPFGATGYEGPGVTFTNISADQTSGVVNFNPPLAPFNPLDPSKSTTYFGLEMAIQTLCPPINPPDRLGQGVPFIWAADFLGHSNVTIQDYGCFITSAAMTINYHAAKQGSTFRTDPRLLNQYLTANNAIDASGAVPFVDWPLFAKYARDSGVQLYYSGVVGRRDDFTLDQYLCNSQPPMLYVGTPHWVFTTGQTAVNGVNTYAILDPDSYVDGKTLEGTPAWNKTYTYMLLFSDIFEPLAGLYVTAHSPVELLLTAPDGSQTGFNPVTNARLDSIPFSGYVTLSLVNDRDHTRPALPESKNIGVQDPASGSYTVQVFGTGAGEYTLNLKAYDSNGHATEVPSFTGGIIPGVTQRFTVSYSSLAGSSVSVKHVVTIADILTEVQIATQQGFIDNAGIANSLSRKLQSAQAALSRGQQDVARNILRAFVNEVSAQSGKHIQVAAANLLVGDASSVQLLSP